MAHRVSLGAKHVKKFIPVFGVMARIVPATE